MIIKARIRMMTFNDDRSIAHAVVEVNGKKINVDVDVAGLIGKQIEQTVRMAAIKKDMETTNYGE